MRSPSSRSIIVSVIFLGLIVAIAVSVPVSATRFRPLQDLPAGPLPPWLSGVDGGGSADSLDSTDDRPPETLVISGPSGSVPEGSLTFAFTASESDSSFECRLDGWARWQPCSSPQTYPSLNPGDRTFSVRATDRAGNTDPTPATRSFTIIRDGTGAGSSDPPDQAPPSGKIVQADYMTRACPIDDLWGAVSDAYYHTRSCSNWSDARDPQVDYFPSDGSPVPGQDGQVHPGYRRLRLTDGMQSKYDATCRNGSPCNDSYRTQLISNSDTRTYYPMRPGHRYVWWLSVRFQNQTPLAGYPDNQDGNTQIWQIKNQGSTCEATTASGTQPGPIEMMDETANTIRLTVRNRNGTTADGAKRIDHFPIGERGIWQTFALDVYYSSDPTKAAYRLWADQDGDSTLELVPLTPKITDWRTAIGPDCIGYPSIGPYQPMSLPAVCRDYGTNEMVEVPVGADWE
jgi:hypothetical protein